MPSCPGERRPFFALEILDSEGVRAGGLLCESPPYVTTSLLSLVFEARVSLADIQRITFDEDLTDVIEPDVAGEPLRETLGGDLGDELGLHSGLRPDIIL